MGTATVQSQPTCQSATATVLATANCGYQFMQWSDGNTDNPRSVTVTSDTTFTAEFDALPAVNYAVTPSGHTLYYNIENGEAQVTFENATSPRYTDLTGDLIIPDSVTLNCVKYAVTSIGDSAFYGCANMTSVSIPNSVTVIGIQTFSYCTGLSAVTIPESVTHIGSSAFGHCSNITAVTFNAVNCTTMGGYNLVAFFYCSNLSSLTIGDNVQIIPDYAFKSHNHLTGPLVIPNSVTKIGREAFSGQTGLTSLTLGNSVGEIGELAFYGCTGLTSLTLSESVTNFGNRVFGNCRGLTSVVIPNSVTSISDYLFSECSSLTSVTIPNSVTSIGYGAFLNCISLHTVTIPSSVNVIGGSAFGGCTGLTEITCLASTAPTLGVYSNAFSDVTNTIPVNIPCGSLASYQSGWSYFSNFVEPANPYTINVLSANNTYGTATMTTVPTCSNNTAVISATANDCYQFTQWNDGNTDNPRTVTVTSDTAFIAYFEAATITEFDAVAASGQSLHYTVNADGTSVTITGHEANISGDLIIPATVTYCNNTYDVTRIGDWAFGSDLLNSVTIPTSVTYFGSYAFYNCSNLARTYYTGTIAQWCEIDIEWWGNPISISYNLYIDGEVVRDLVIPEGVTRIKTRAFEWLYTLNTLTLPSTITTIGVIAFHNCPSLSSVTCNATVPPAMEGGVFQLDDTNIPVYVPCGSVAVYRAANEWSAFPNIQEQSGCSLTVTVTANDATKGNVTGGGTYSNGETATLTATPNSGYRFLRWNDNITDNPRQVVVTQDTSFTAIFDVLTVENYEIRTCTGQTLLFEVENGNHTARVIGYVGQCTGSLTVPAWFSVDGERYEVTAIGPRAFENCTGLVSVILPRSITLVDTEAFKGCSALVTVDMK